MIWIFQYTKDDGCYFIISCLPFVAVVCQYGISPQPPLPLFFFLFKMDVLVDILYLASNLQPPTPPLDCYLPLNLKIFCLLRLSVCFSLSPLQCFDIAWPSVMFVEEVELGAGGRLQHQHCLPPCAWGGRVWTTSLTSKQYQLTFLQGTRMLHNTQPFLLWRHCLMWSRRAGTKQQTSHHGTVIWCTWGRRATKQQSLLVATLMRPSWRRTELPIFITFEVFYCTWGGGGQTISPHHNIITNSSSSFAQYLRNLRKANNKQQPLFVVTLTRLRNTATKQ